MSKDLFKVKFELYYPYTTPHILKYEYEYEFTR